VGARTQPRCRVAQEDTFPPTPESACARDDRMHIAACPPNRASGALRRHGAHVICLPPASPCVLVQAGVHKCVPRGLCFRTCAPPRGPCTAASPLPLLCPSASPQPDGLQTSLLCPSTPRRRSPTACKESPLARSACTTRPGVHWDSTARSHVGGGGPFGVPGGLRADRGYCAPQRLRTHRLRASALSFDYNIYYVRLDQSTNISTPKWVCPTNRSSDTSNHIRCSSSSPLGRAHVLQSRKFPVHSFLAHQLVMPSLLHNLPLVKHIDHVGLLDRAQAVRNSNGGAALRGRVERVLHHAFRGRVKSRRGFVEEPECRVSLCKSDDFVEQHDLQNLRITQ
jgi:hypothetical protein